jgi:hypothetical protein
MKTPHSILLFCFFLTCLNGCGLVRSSVQSVTKQGLTGYVYEQIGNAMPLRDKPIIKGRPLSTTIYVYAPLKVGDVSVLVGQMATKVNARIIDSCLTDETGHFTMPLQPGRYSVLVQYEHAYFVPFYAGQDGLAIMEVKPASFTALDIIVNAKASY